MPDGGQQIPFDYLGAKKAGYTDEEIGSFLKDKYNFQFDITGAKKSGYSDKEIADYITAYEPDKKKVSVGGVLSKGGGMVGTLNGNPQSESQDEKTVLTNAITQTPFKKNEQPFDQTKNEAIAGAHNKVNEVMYGDGEDWKDPVKAIAKDYHKDPAKAIGAIELTKQSLAPDGFEAKKTLASTLLGKYGAENLTTSLVKQKADEYDKVVQPLRDLQFYEHGNTQTDNPLFDMYSKEKIYSAAIKSYANEHPLFKEQAQKAGIDLNDWQIMNLVPEGKRGAIMKEFLQKPEVTTFLEKENPSLVPAIQDIQKNILTDNPSFGIAEVANKVSRAVQKSGFNTIEPIFNYYGQNHKEVADLTAKEVLNPDELKIWNDHIKDNQEQYMDAPSFFQSFAQKGKEYGQGLLKTFTEPFTPTSEAIKNNWEKEATNVSADPQGLSKYLSSAGGAFGTVASILGTAGVTGIANPATAGAAATTLGFFGDQLEQGKVKFPQSPIKAWSSAVLNTGLYAALSYDIFPGAKAKQAFESVQPELSNVIENLASGKITREAARQQYNTIAKKAIDFAGGTLSKGARIAAEVTGIQGANRAFDKLTGLKEFEQFHPDDEIAKSLSSSFFSFLPLAGLGKLGEMKQRNRMMEESLYEAATNPKRYERVINDLDIKDPSVNKDDLLSNLKFLTDTKASLDQRGISLKNQKRYLFEAMRDKVAQGNKEAAGESTIAKKESDQSKQSQEIKDRILNGEDADQIIPKDQQDKIDEQKDTQIQLERLAKDNELDNKKVDNKIEQIDGRESEENRIKLQQLKEEKKRINEDYQREVEKLSPKVAEEPTLPPDQEKIGEQQLPEQGVVGENVVGGDLEAKKADIEKRRQEELGGVNSHHDKTIEDLERIKKYGNTANEAIDNIQKKAEQEGRKKIVGKPNEQGLQQVSYDFTEEEQKVFDSLNRLMPDEKAFNEPIDDVINFWKSDKEKYHSSRSSKSKTGQINNKYDAELAALPEPSKQNVVGDKDETFYTGRGKKFEDLQQTRGGVIFFSKNPKVSEWYGGDESNVTKAKLDTSNFIDLTTQDKKAEFVKENFTDEDIHKLYPDIKTRAQDDRDVRKTYEQKEKELLDKYRERLQENRFSSGKEQKLLLDKIKEKGYSGAKLADNFFGNEDISYVVLDKSVIGKQNVVGKGEGVGGKSILGSDVDLKGDKKEDWMNPYDGWKFDIDAAIGKLPEESKANNIVVVNKGAFIGDPITYYRDGKFYKGKSETVREIIKSKGGEPPTEKQIKDTSDKLVRKYGKDKLFNISSTDHYGNWVVEADFVNKASKVSKEDVQSEVDARNESKHNSIVSFAIKDGWYQKAIDEGRMTANDVKTIIESAGLEVPKDIIEKAKNETLPQADNTDKQGALPPKEGKQSEADVNKVGEDAGTSQNPPKKPIPEATGGEIKPPSGNEPTGSEAEEKAPNKRTGIKNAVSDATRQILDLPEVQLPKIGSDMERLAEGKRLVESGEINPEEVIDKVIAGKGKIAMQPGEGQAMQYYMHQLGAAQDLIQKQLSLELEPQEKARLINQMQELNDLEDRATEANMLAGTAWSDIGNTRKILVDLGFNASREKALIKQAYGGEVPKEVQEKMDAAIKERDEAILKRNQVEELLRQKEAEAATEKMKGGRTKGGKKDYKAKRQSLKDDLKKAKDEHEKWMKDNGIQKAGVGFTLTGKMIKIIGEYAKTYIEEGAEKLAEVIQKVYDEIKDIFPGIDKKDIRDAIASHEATKLETKAQGIESKVEAQEISQKSKLKLKFQENSDWRKANQRVYNAENKIRRMKSEALQSQKNMLQKAFMWGSKLIRGTILSGTNVLYKLASAAAIGGAAKRIPEQVAGVLWSNIYRGIAKKAPIEGFPNVKAEIKFYKEFFNPAKFVRNTWQIGKTHSSYLSKKMGENWYDDMAEITMPGKQKTVAGKIVKTGLNVLDRTLTLPLDIHQMIKDPVKRATFEASMHNGMVWAEKQGMDISDPLIRNSLEVAAYKRANYEIFQEKRWLSKMFNDWKNKLDKSGTAGSAAKLLVDFMLPVSTVPTNIAARVLSTSPLGMIRGQAKVIDAYRKGIENLQPEEADAIMRQLKQGSLGTALWLIGWLGYAHYGGLYSKYDPNRKRKMGDFPSDEMEVNGKMIPKPVQHALPLEVIQMAATARRIYDNYKENKGTTKAGAALKAALGSIGAVAEQIPMLSTGARTLGALNDPYEGKKLEEDIKRRFQPQFLRERNKPSELKMLQDKEADSKDVFKNDLKAYDKNGKPREISLSEFKNYKEKRDEEIKSNIATLYANGVPDIQDGKVVMKPFSQLSDKEQRLEIAEVKRKATEKINKQLLGEKQETVKQQIQKAQIESYKEIQDLKNKQ